MRRGDGIRPGAPGFLADIGARRGGCDGIRAPASVDRALRRPGGLGLSRRARSHGRGERAGELARVGGGRDVHPCIAELLGDFKVDGQLEAESPHEGGVCERVARRSVEGDAAAVHDDDALRAQGVVHEVGDVHDGHAARVELRERALDHLPSGGVEHRGGLVEQEHLRLHGEGSGDGDALLLPSGEVGGVCIGVVVHADGC